MLLTALLPAAMQAQVKTDSTRVANQMMRGVDSHYLDSIEHYYDSIQTELGPVTVSAVKPLVKMEADKMSYDVSGDVDAKASTVLDMLRKVPMVVVDGQDNITVNGSGAFKVYVNGKPNPMFSSNASQIFKMMPASMVSKIEVITNPGAKYDAEGATGVLNIVMAQLPGMGGAGAGGAETVNGVTGTVRGSASNRGYNGGVSLTAQEGRLSVSANVLGHFQNLKGLEIDFTQEAAAGGGGSVTNRFRGKQRTPFGMGDLSLQYDIDSLNVVSATVGVTAFRVKGDHRPEVVMTGSAFGQDISYAYDSRTRMKSTSLDVTADWQHFFGGSRDKYLTLSYMLSHAPQTNDITQLYDQPFFMPDVFNHNKPTSTENTFQLDYTTPLGKGQTLSLGSKYIQRNSKSVAEYYTLADGERQAQDDRWVDYRYTNRIAAAYAEYELNLGVFGAKAGMRYEHTWQDVSYKRGNGADFDKDYGCLVPSLSVNIRPAMTKNIGLTYNMRISRPGITYLNPYVDRSNPTNISYGNSYLDVEKTHNIGLSFSSFTAKLMYNLSLQQNFCDNQISDYSFYQDNLLHTTYGNIVKRRHSSANLFVNWLALPKTRLMMNGALTYVDLRSSRLGQRNHGWQGNLMGGLQQTLPWDLKLSLNAIYNSKSYTLQGYTSAFKIGVASLTKSLLKDRLNITVQGILPLDKGGDLIIESHTRGKDFSSRQHIKVPIAQVGLSVSYTFGNMGVKAKRHESRIESDFSEKKSSEEQIGNAGGGTQSAGMGGLGM